VTSKGYSNNARKGKGFPRLNKNHAGKALDRKGRSAARSGRFTVHVKPTPFIQQDNTDNG